MAIGQANVKECEAKGEVKRLRKTNNWTNLCEGWQENKNKVAGGKWRARGKLKEKWP